MQIKAEIKLGAGIDECRGGRGAGEHVAQSDLFCERFHLLAGARGAR